MSVNYYLKLPPEQNVKSAMDTLDRLALISKALPRSDDIERAIANLSEMIAPEQGIHIGKYTGGSRFTFSSITYKSFDEWMDVLKLHPECIVSEYGNSVPLQEIIETILETKKYPATQKQSELKDGFHYVDREFF